MKRYKMYINGEWVESQRNRVFPVMDPASEEAIAEAPDAEEKDPGHRPRRRSEAGYCSA
jgi:(Z)-2-((N-methylformamido)methylene)-5-hydroxybutyrolactone dehydrogenase